MRVLLCCLLLPALAAGRLGAAENRPGGLQVQMIPTIQYAHQDIWTKTPNGRGPKFAGVGRIVRNQPVHILVSCHQFGVGANGEAAVTYRVACFRPDGSAGDRTTELRLITRETGREPQAIHRAIEQAVFTFGPDDALGTWRIVVEATDVVSGATVRKEQPLTVCGDVLLQEPLPPGTQLDRWLSNYYQHPEPQLLFAALQRASESPPGGSPPKPDIENGFWLGFFEQVLADNPWLLPHVIARLEQAQGRERALLATSLAYAKRDEFSFVQTLPDKARAVFMPYRLQNWPAPTAEPLKGAQLDVLWGRFFASGRYGPIRELAGVLAYHPYAKALDEFRKQAAKPTQPPVEVQKSLVFGAAIWSLRSNIQKDKVVRDYCEGMLLRKELPAAEQGLLVSIFTAGVKDLPKNAAAPSSAEALSVPHDRAN